MHLNIWPAHAAAAETLQCCSPLLWAGGTPFAGTASDLCNQAGNIEPVPVWQRMQWNSCLKEEEESECIFVLGLKSWDTSQNVQTPRYFTFCCASKSTIIHNNHKHRRIKRTHLVGTKSNDWGISQDSDENLWLENLTGARNSEGSSKTSETFWKGIEDFIKYQLSGTVIL